MVSVLSQVGHIHNLILFESLLTFISLSGACTDRHGFGSNAPVLHMQELPINLERTCGSINVVANVCCSHPLSTSSHPGTLPVQHLVPGHYLEPPPTHCCAANILLYTGIWNIFRFLISTFSVTTTSTRDAARTPLPKLPDENYRQWWTLL